MRKLPNWIEAYLAYTYESESPDVFHKWVAINQIGGALRRKSFYDMGYFLVYPNLYVVLVSPAGRCKKSTAMRVGRSVLGEVPGVEWSVDSTTRERLIQDLSQSYKDGQSAMTAHSSEFASLLTSSGMDMVVFLTDIFDCPSEWTHKTKSGGSNKIKAPFLNLLGATTPDWIATAMPLDTIGIGLTSRIVFVYSNTPRVRPPRPKLTSAQKGLHPLLVHDLTAISQISGEYVMDPECERVYDDWYESRIQDPNPSGDARLAGYFERKPIHLIKVMMIVAASKSDDMVMTVDHYHEAHEYLSEIEEELPRVFANVGKNPLNKDVEDVMATIISKPEGFARDDLIARFKHSVRVEELDEVLDTLQAMKVILFDSTTHRYRRIK